MTPLEPSNGNNLLKTETSDTIEAEFTLTRRDYLAAAKLFQSRRAIRWLPRLLALLLVGLSIVELLVGDFEAALLSSMGVIFILLLPFTVLRLQVHTSYRRATYKGVSMRVRIDQDEIHTESIIGTSTIRHLYRVLDGREGILCCISNNQSIFIPRRAIEGEKRLALALERLRQLTLPIQY